MSQLSTLYTRSLSSVCRIDHAARLSGHDNHPGMKREKDVQYSGCKSLVLAFLMAKRGLCWRQLFPGQARKNDGPPRSVSCYAAGEYE